MINPECNASVSFKRVREDGIAKVYGVFDCKTCPIKKLVVEPRNDVIRKISDIQIDNCPKIVLPSSQ